MFTGLVEAIGVVRHLSRRGHEARIGIESSLEGLVLGESVCVGGACLTVAAIRGTRFEADASAETLACSTLGRLAVGARVNLERACRLDDRLGGHLVTGHVDAVGSVQSLESGRGARRLVLSAPEALGRFLASKGSIAVDGVSLTVNRVGSADGAQGPSFEVMLVPHTWGRTTLAELRPTDGVNLEVDILARYVARQLEHAVGVASAEPTDDRSRAGTHSAHDQALLTKLRQGGIA